MVMSRGRYQMTIQAQINSAQDARAAAKLAVALGMPTYDLTSEMNKRGIPAQFRGAWLNAVEDALGIDDDGADDGYGWENAALRGVA
jgi:hypothetical protein